ncbi:MAG: hypothetical protein EP330_30125 [Deltaproteobacteria bacterium]|nr:MAG: hypothetical protein EP330_30125 [Deltaproteobacteria bacterium]
MLPFLLAMGALAGDASIHLVFPPGDTPMLDGQPMQVHRTTPDEARMFAEPGTHELRLVDGVGRVQARGSVELPEGFELRCTATRGELDCASASAMHGATEAPEAWGLAGGVSLAVHTDGEWVDVWVDGRRALELRNEPLGLVRMDKGLRRIELRDAGADRGWADGEIQTGHRTAVTLRFDIDRTARFDDGVRWHSGGGAGVPRLARPSATTVQTSTVFGHDLDQPTVHIATSDPWNKAPPRATIPDVVVLHLRNLDREWGDVRIDGEVVAEFRGSELREVRLPPGRHRIAVHEFLEELPYATGTLDTGTAGDITLELTEGEPPRTPTGAHFVADPTPRLDPGQR